MVLLSRGNTCLTHVYYPTPRPLHSNGSGRYAIYTCLVEYFKFRGSLRALYIHVCNKITTLISCHMAHLPIFFICMNNSTKWFINNTYPRANGRKPGARVTNFVLAEFKVVARDR